MGKHKSRKKTSHKMSRKDDKDRGPRSSGYKRQKSSRKKEKKKIDKEHKEQGQQGKMSFLFLCLFGLFCGIQASFGTIRCTY